MQSSDYKPWVSGWKLDKATGELEINSAKLSLGALPSDPQLITVTAGEWAEYELPSNAMEHYAFIGDELVKIPFEYRDSAELSTGDNSFDRDGSDVRTTLTYRRPETAEEVEARQNKVKTGGTSIKLVGGVLTVIHDGVVRCQIGGLPELEKPRPFIVVDGVSYIREAEVERGSITNAKIGDNWSVKVELCNGRYVATGISSGLASSDTSASAESQLTTRITALEGRTLSQGQAITALNNPYSSKADQSTVDALASRVTSVEGAIASIPKLCELDALIIKRT